jgi:tetratricopeptide (TPR) repeat protein
MPHAFARSLSGIILFFIFSICAFPGWTQNSSSEQVRVPPPAPLHRVEPPNPVLSGEELERRGDLLRSEKAYLDSLDYYRAALTKGGNPGILYNKMGITELQMQRFKDALKDFQRSVKADKDYADAYNNIGVIYYLQKKYGKAIKNYGIALKLREDSASFHSNLGSAYFSKKKFDKATEEYTRALQLDPDIFDRTSLTGVAAQMSSPEDRAHYDYVVAKMYARLGVADRSLLYLRKAMEEGYKDINDVYKDAEFASLRKDPRFIELMAAKPPAIPE